MRYWLWTLFLTPLILQAAQAMTLDDLVVGKTVLGPNLSTKELKGKVVYVEYWGTR